MHQSLLVHLLDQSIDVLLPVTKITTLDVVLELASAEAAIGVGQLEGPQEVVCLLEVGSDCEDLMDQVFNADNAILTEGILDKLVVSQSNALLVNLAISTLIDKLTHGLEVGITVSDVWVDNGQHLLSGLGQLDKDTVVDLEKTKELENFARLGGNLVDTMSC